MSWKQLQIALGTGYTDAASLRKAIKPALLKIQTIYPDLVIGERDGGIDVLLYPAFLSWHLTAIAAITLFPSYNSSMKRV